jgi:hypothetical protein
MPTIHPISTIKKNPRIALAAAALLHIAVTITLFGVGRLGVVPQQFDRDGIGEFASDSRAHKDAADQLAGLLRQARIGSWINSPDPPHVKIDSLSLLALEPLLGSNILAVEPVNLLCYLAILALTFSVAQITAGRGAAWLAGLIVALWPSLILHTTQVLRDPLMLAAFLALMGVLVTLLKTRLGWLHAAAATLVGAASIYVVWRSRPDLWLIIIGIVVLCAFLSLIKLVWLRKLLAFNLAAIALLGVFSLTRRPPAMNPAYQRLAGNLAVSSIWGRIAIARKKFIMEGGAMIDADVTFHSSTDVIKYIPRALEIGYLAPFPSMWFEGGYNVGRAGRLMSGIETTLTYLLEILACVFLWKNKEHFSSWLLLLTTMIGILALGLVVVNTGTLYRMRYPFWTLIVIMAAGVLPALKLKRYKPAGEGISIISSNTDAGSV